MIQWKVRDPGFFFVATGDSTPPKNRFGYVPKKPHGEGRIDSPTAGDPRARKDSKHFIRKLAHVGFFFNMYTYMRTGHMSRNMLFVSIKDLL